MAILGIWAVILAITKAPTVRAGDRSEFKATFQLGHSAPLKTPDVGNNLKARKIGDMVVSMNWGSLLWVSL